MSHMKDPVREIRFGLIGAGRIAQTYVEAIAVASNARLAGIADPEGDCAQALAEPMKCGYYARYQDMVEEAKPEAVIVTSPPSTHSDIALRLLRAGIPVLCEKPVAFEVDTARQIAETARDNDVLFSMASKFRYVDDVIRAKSIISSGLLGDVVLFENTFMSRVDMTSRWNSQRGVSGGGVLIDNGTHSVDIMRYLIGPLDEIHVIEGKRRQGLPVEETVRVLVRSESGVIGSIDLSWSLNKEIDHYIAVYGSQGTLRVGWKESTYKQADNREWIVFGKGYNKIDAFRRQIENFSLAVQGKDKLLITPADAVASVEAIQAGYSALENGRWASLKEENILAAQAAL